MGSIESVAGKIGGEILKSVMKKDNPVREFAESIADKFIDKLSDALQNRACKEHSQDSPGEFASSPRIHTIQGVLGFQSFDQDGNGTVSRDELTHGLKDLTQQITDLKTQHSSEETASTGSNASARANLAHAERLYAVGQEVLNRFEQVAMLDKQPGLGTEDLTALAGLDGKTRTISSQDWRMLYALGQFTGSPTQI